MKLGLDLKFICSLVLVFFCSLLNAQTGSDEKEEQNYLKLKGLSYGFNFGVYFPGNKTANYYNGSGRNNLHDAIISTTNYLYQPRYIYDSIKNKIFKNDFAIKELPQHMRYSVATNIGFYTKFNFDDNFGMYLEINHAKLKTTDKVTFDVFNGVSIKNVSAYSIHAKESRVDINLGIMRSFGKRRIFKPYVEGAFNLNNTKVLSADINFDYTENGITKNLTYSYLYQDYQYFIKRDDGIGYGVLAGGGVQVIVNQAMLLYTGIDFTLKKIHLGDNKNYNLNSFIYLRLLFRNLISTKADE